MATTEFLWAKLTEDREFNHRVIQLRDDMLKNNTPRVGQCDVYGFTTYLLDECVKRIIAPSTLAVRLLLLENDNEMVGTLMSTYEGKECRWLEAFHDGSPGPFWKTAHWVSTPWAYIPATPVADSYVTHPMPFTTVNDARDMWRTLIRCQEFNTLLAHVKRERNDRVKTEWHSPGHFTSYSIDKLIETIVGRCMSFEFCSSKRTEAREPFHCCLTSQDDSNPLQINATFDIDGFSEPEQVVWASTFKVQATERSKGRSFKSRIRT